MKDMLKGQTALITGGASGMGEATVVMFAKEGANVVIGDINVAKGEALAKRLNDEGYVARFYGQMDVTNDEQINFIVESAAKEFGRIDIFVQYAGRTFGDNGNTDNIDMNDWNKTLDVNLTGNFKTVLAVLPYMKKQKYGRIVLCSSNGAFNPTTTTYHYHAAKAGMESITVNLAFELAPYNITANCVVPGAILTPFWDELMAPGPERDAFTDALAKKEIPLGRMGNGDDIAGAALFFVSELGRYVTGHRMYVGGGMGYVYSHNATFLMSDDNKEVNK